MTAVHMMTSSTVAAGHKVVETVCGLTIDMPTGKRNTGQPVVHDTTGWRSHVTCDDCADILDGYLAVKEGLDDAS